MRGKISWSLSVTSPTKEDKLEILLASAKNRTEGFLFKCINDLQIMTKECQIKHIDHIPQLRGRTVKGIPRLKLTLHQKHVSLKIRYWASWRENICSWLIFSCCIQRVLWILPHTASLLGKLLSHILIYGKQQKKVFICHAHVHFLLYTGGLLHHFPIWHWWA